MRRVHVFLALAIGGLVLAGLAIAGLNNNSVVHANGSFEVPVRDTPAHAVAIFHIAKDGKSIDYRLNVDDITNVTQAHIHCGSPGVNGPVIVFLYPDVDGPALPPADAQGPLSGTIANGTIEDNHVIDKTATQCPPDGVADIGDVIERLQNGGAYVNLHTDDGVAPTNTGPGDFPQGEIRGDTP